MNVFSENWVLRLNFTDVTYLCVCLQHNREKVDEIDGHVSHLQLVGFTCLTQPTLMPGCFAYFCLAFPFSATITTELTCNKEVLMKFTQHCVTTPKGDKSWPTLLVMHKDGEVSFLTSGLDNIQKAINILNNPEEVVGWKLFDDLDAANAFNVQIAIHQQKQKRFVSISFFICCCQPYNTILIF